MLANGTSGRLRVGKSKKRLQHRLLPASALEIGVSSVVVRGLRAKPLRVSDVLNQERLHTRCDTLREIVTDFAAKNYNSY